MARFGPSVGGTPRKQVLFFDRNILLSEKFKAGRPNGIAYKMPEPEFRDANAELALIAADEVVYALEQRIAARGRPQKDTEDLLHALSDPRNRDSDAFGFTVGNDEFLQSTRAGRYYRNLEYGSSVFVGRIIEGFFAGTTGRPTEPGQGRAIEGVRDALRLVQTGDFTNPADTRSGRFSQPASDNPSASSRTAGTFPVKGGGGAERHIEGSRRGPSRPITIRNPIPRYDYFKDGIAAFQKRARGSSGLIAELYREAAQAFIERGGLVIE